jgi:uncharacterized protein DUF3617
MSPRKIGVFGMFLAIVATAAWAQLSVRPGQYQVSLEMQLPGSPQPTTAETFDCLAPEDAQDLAKAMLRELANESACTASNQQTAGNKLSFDVACAVEGQQVKSTIAVTVVSAESYSAVMDVEVAPGTKVSTRMIGKWVGAVCTAEQPGEE